jgi:hypothetical protein
MGLLQPATGYMKPEKSIPYQKINKVYSFVMIKVNVICGYLCFNTAAIQSHLIGIPLLIMEMEGIKQLYAQKLAHL